MLAEQTCCYTTFDISHFSVELTDWSMYPVIIADRRRCRIKGVSSNDEARQPLARPTRAAGEERLRYEERKTRKECRWRERRVG